MPKTTLRQFTGGLSNEIDAQNLREDQGEEALDINLKGHALEPGEGTAPISGGHYYYRGEWIKDSKAVSFEEAGIGVVKTYNEKRPEFEQIIKDDVNISRKLGPPLPPSAVITGTVVSEGTRGERPAEGSHLLKLPETALGEVDKVVGSTPAQSLKTYEADSTTLIDDIHYYNGQAYWLVKSGSSWTVVTRAYSSALSGFTGVDISSSACIHNSKGSFFKAGYFVCWDNTFIDSVQLDNISMSGSKFDIIETTNPSDGGDAGAQGFGDNAGGNFTTGATSNEITGVDIDGTGIISFSQKITTAGTLPTAYTHSENERWLRIPSGSHGCFVVFLRDGVSHSDSEASGTTNNSTEALVEVLTDKNKDVFPGWGTKSGGFVYKDPNRDADDPNKYIAEDNKKINAQVQANLDSLGDIDYGIQYAVVFAKNDTWVRVRYQDPVAKPPEMFVIKCTSSGSESKTKDISFTRTLTSHKSATPGKWKSYGYHSGIALVHAIGHYDDVIDIELTLNAISGDNKLHYKYAAPIGGTGEYPDGGLVFNPSKQCSSYVRVAPGSGSPIFWERYWYWAVEGSQAGTNGAHNKDGQAGSWTRYLGKASSNTKLSWVVKDSGTNGSYKNGTLTSPAVSGKMNRLCSYVRGGATTQQGAFGISELWTTATFASADNSISFAEATTKNFRAGDYIKIGQNRTNKSMHLNLRGTALTSGLQTKIDEQTFITAKIISVGVGKLILAPPELKQNKQGDKETYLDEECYPLISGYIEYNPPKRKTYDKPDGGPVCSVIKSDLSSHVLVGHGYFRTYNHVRLNYAKTGTYDVIEVRLAGAEEILPAAIINYTHRISWTGGDYRTVSDGAGGTVRKRIPHEVRAVEYLGTPRIFYTKGSQSRKLYSQKGSGADVPPNPVPLSLNGGYYVDKDYLTHFDDKGITIYTPDLLNKPFVKANPTLSNGLGLTGNVTDARTFVAPSTYAVYVCVKIDNYWKLVKTSSAGPESSLLSYDFKKPIGFDGTKIWGIADESSGWDIQYATPFFESHIIGSWVFFANSYTTVTPTISAWGQVVDFRIGEKSDTGTPRYLSVDWKMDSGVYFGTGTPTIGLNHEVNKMIVENTFKWYPVQDTFNLTTSGTGTVIADIPNVTNTFTPLAAIEIPFTSKVFRDIVFFKKSETLLPTAGDTGGENKITFVNYNDPGQSFYVLSDNVFKVVKRVGVEPEDAYRLGQVATGGTAFDASKIGISTFLIGAPNMYNGYGPNIDLYYRASFVNKWGHESAPSPLPSKGITALDSADDCVQVNFNAPFFRFDDKYIDTIRLYRYGGDSSEFLFLKDIPMPTLPVDAEGVKSFPTISGINSITNGFSRKSAISPYYLFKTSKDISSLSGFTNSNFLLTATPSSLDGSWRVNQISENSSPSVTYTTPLVEELNTTGTTVKLTDAANPSAWPASGVVKIGSEYISYANIAAGVATVGTIVDSGGEHTAYHDSSVPNVSLSGGSGTGVKATVSVNASDLVNTVTITTAGTGYKIGDILTIPNQVIGGSGFLNGGSQGTEATVVVATLTTGDGTGDELTGCVRGINSTNASVHKKSSIKDFTVTAGGTGWGYTGGTSGWRECTSFSVSTDQSSDIWIQCNAPGHGLQQGSPVMFKTAGTLPALVSPAPTVYYASTCFTNSFVFATSIGTPGVNNTTGNPITHNDTDLGSGTHLLNGCIIKAPAAMTKVIELAESDSGYTQFTTYAHGLNANSKVRLSTVATSVACTATDGIDIDFNATGHGLTVGEKVQIHLVGGVVDGGWSTPVATGLFEYQENSTNVSQTSTSGRGTGAKFSFSTSNQYGTPLQVTITITMTTAGSGYKVGDTILIRDPGNGGYANTGETITLTLTSVSGSPALATNTNINTDYYIHNDLTTNSFKLTTDSNGGGTPLQYGSSGGAGLEVRTSGTLPTGFAPDIDYYVRPLGTPSADRFRLSATSNGTPISFNGRNSGILSWSHSQGGGTGLYGTYEVNSSGVITAGNVENAGTGYTEAPEFLDLYDPGLVGGTPSNLDGTGANLSVVFDTGASVNVVEWELEMEHRNQDTTTLTVAISTALTGTANVVNVTDTTVFPDASSGSPKKILIGNEILTYTGKTSTTFTGVTPGTEGTIASIHGLNVLVRSYDEVYATSTVTNASIEIEGFGFRDKARTPISSLYDMQTDNFPPLGLEYNEGLKQFFETESEDDYFRYIKAVGSMYFGALDANLRFSKYGTPEYWPLSAVITLDSEIRCIEEYAGEGLVFTTNSLYRVRGTDPKAMVAFRVPDARGLPAGYEHTVSDFNGGLMWLTASDGICMYSAGRATYLTRDKHDIGRLKAPYSCVVDGVYWLFQEPGSGTGYRLELSTGEMRLAQTTIEAYYAYFAKALGVGVVVTKDDSINSDDVISLTGSTTANGDATVTVSSTDNLTEGMLVTGDGIPVNTTIKSVTSPTVFELSANATATATVTLTFPLFLVKEIGGDKAKNIEWRSKKIDAGEPAIPKALGSVAIVYEALNSTSGDTIVDGIRGQALAAELLGLDPEDLDAGDINGQSETITDLYSIFTKYDEPNQTYIIDTDGTNLTNTERRTILMPVGFDTSTVTVGNRVWNELLADNTEVESLTTTTISGVVYPSIVLNKEPLRTGTGTIYWGNLPMVEIYLNNDDTPSRVFTLPPGDVVETQSMDLYLKDLKRFRTISVAIQGDVRVQALSLRHYSLQNYQSSTLHHSADIFYKGDIDFRVMLDGSLVYRKELSNAGDDFKEERIYLPASSFGQRAHYMNESRSGMIESVNFNGTVAA